MLHFFCSELSAPCGWLGRAAQCRTWGYQRTPVRATKSVHMRTCGPTSFGFNARGGGERAVLGLFRRAGAHSTRAFTDGKSIKARCKGAPAASYSCCICITNAGI